MLQYILYAIALILVILSYQDLKSRAVNDILAYILLSLAIIYFILNQISSFSLYSIIVVVLIVLLSLFSYLQGYWALGDLIGISSVIMIDQSPLFLILLFNLIALFLVFYVSIYNFVNKIKQQNIFRLLILDLLLGIILFITIKVNFLIIPEISLTIATLISIILLWDQIETYQQNAYYYADPKELLIGDWLVEPIEKDSIKIPVRKQGLTKEDIEKIKDLGIKVKIKRGVPLLPGFMLSTLVLVLLSI